MKRLIAIALIVLGCLTATLPTANAQCGIENKAFKAGEFLSYDLYFNWKFVWVKAGTAAMSTVKSSFEGKEALRTSLTTRSSSRVDKIFILRDTLLSYVTPGLSPLYFRKGAHEGDRYYIDEIWFSYPNGNCHLRQHQINHEGKHSWKETEYKECIYDMMDMFLKARNFEPNKMSKGQKIALPIADGKRLFNSWITYRGKQNVAMKDGSSKFRCVVFSFYEREDGETSEIARFFVTDDDNHIPVRIDLFLRFGSAKAYLKGWQGLKNQMEAKLK